MTLHPKHTQHYLKPSRRNRNNFPLFKVRCLISFMHQRCIAGHDAQVSLNFEPCSRSRVLALVSMTSALFLFSYCSVIAVQFLILYQVCCLKQIAIRCQNRFLHFKFWDSLLFCMWTYQCLQIVSCVSSKHHNNLQSRCIHMKKDFQNHKKLPFLVL